jgi:mitogen-activated protein kinase kinase kinase 7
MGRVASGRGSKEIDGRWRESESISSDEACDFNDEEMFSDTQSEEEEELDEHDEGFGMQFVASLRRRGHRVGNMVNRLSESFEGHRQNDAGANKEKRRTLRLNIFTRCFTSVDEISSTCSRRISKWLLLSSMVVWLSANAAERLLAREQLESLSLRDSSPGLDTVSRKRRMRQAKLALGSAAVDAPDDFLKSGLQNLHNEEKIDIEALPNQCVRSEWQTLSFPNCNNIHEIDLREALGLSRRERENKGSTNIQAGYIGSGLWRNVWKVYPNGPMTQADGMVSKPAVLKTMIKEHDVDERNLDRHRRDALVMERLTSSANIIDVYGFCGNTILSEYVSAGLDRIIFDDEHNDRSNETVSVSRESSLGRLRLALGVAKGVAALHSIVGGPIVHGDLQAKQFLVDVDGTIKLNDFNRCRFIAHHNDTKQACPIRIPQAPGAARAPEEYDFKPLNEQIDMYSLGHVLFTILTGKHPWGNLEHKSIKAAVRKGTKPFFDPKYRMEGTSDEDLAKLAERAYEYDPKMRITATELVQELENLLRKYGDLSYKRKNS